MSSRWLRRGTSRLGETFRAVVVATGENPATVSTISYGRALPRSAGYADPPQLGLVFDRVGRLCSESGRRNERLGDDGIMREYGLL